MKKHIAAGLFTIAAAVATPHLEARKLTREEVIQREYQPEPKPPMTKQQRKKRQQGKAARKARNTQHAINKKR